ncbi:MAG TPA: hypothetical protein VIL85_28000 [Thermomicrobiales bacterium]
MRAAQRMQLSVSIENDQGRYCCIALTNPTEVMLVDVTGEPVYVNGNALQVQVTNQVDVNLSSAIPLDVEVTNVSPLDVQLTGPTEVVIVDVTGEHVYVHDHALDVKLS